MVALAGARRHLHLAQQCVHFGDREHPPRPNRAVAGDSRGDMVEPVAQAERAAKLGDFGSEIGEQAGDIGLTERRRHRAHQDRGRPESLDLEAEVRKIGLRGFQPVAFRLVELDHLREQQRLTGDHPTLPRSAHPLEHQPLVRGVLVDDYQPILGFSDDISRRDLPAGDAEWEGGHGFDRGLGAASGSVIEEALASATICYPGEGGGP